MQLPVMLVGLSNGYFRSDQWFRQLVVGIMQVNTVCNKNMHTYKATIIRVIDGDTVVVDIDLGFNVVLRDQHVRLAGIDTPETRTHDKEEKVRGLAAKARLKALLPVGGSRILESREFNGSRGKYGRIIGDFSVSDQPTGRTVTEIMKAEGHVK